MFKRPELFYRRGAYSRHHLNPEDFKTPRQYHRALSRIWKFETNGEIGRRNTSFRKLGFVFVPFSNVDEGYEYVVQKNGVTVAFFIRRCGSLQKKHRIGERLWPMFKSLEKGVLYRHGQVPNSRLLDFDNWRESRAEEEEDKLIDRIRRRACSLKRELTRKDPLSFKLYYSSMCCEIIKTSRGFKARFCYHVENMNRVKITRYFQKIVDAAEWVAAHRFEVSSLGYDPVLRYKVVSLFLRVKHGHHIDESEYKEMLKSDARAIKIRNAFRRKRRDAWRRKVIAEAGKTSRNRNVSQLRALGFLFG